jgi:hypothetical protein
MYAVVFKKFNELIELKRFGRWPTRQRKENETDRVPRIEIFLAPVEDQCRFGSQDFRFCRRLARKNKQD